MNNQSKHYTFDESKEFPLYQLFPDTTSNVDEQRGSEIANQHPILIVNESEPRSKLAPIGTGRPSPNKDSTGQWSTHLDNVWTETQQPQGIQEFIIPTVLVLVPIGYIIFYQYYPPCQHLMIANQRSDMIAPIGWQCTQQIHQYKPAACINYTKNTGTVSNKNKILRSRSTTYGTRNSVGNRGHKQLSTKNLERYDANKKANKPNKKTIHGSNNNNNNRKQVISQPSTVAYTAKALPKKTGNPRQPHCDKMQRKGDAAKKNGYNNRNNNQRVSDQCIPKPADPECSAGYKNTSKKQGKSVYYNSYLVYRKKNNTEKHN